MTNKEMKDVIIKGGILIGSLAASLYIIGKAEKIACQMKAKQEEPVPEVKVDENRLKQTVQDVFAKLKRKEVK